jgi:hypothetical protein
MQKEIIRADGNLRREIWYFDLTSFSGRLTLMLSDYYVHTRKTTRCKWGQEKHWNHIFQRDSDLKTPPLPKDVEREIRAYYSVAVDEMPIKIN